MTPQKARALFLEHCQPGDRGTLELYGLEPAANAIIAATKPFHDAIMVIDHYIAQRRSSMTGMGSFVDAAIGNQISALEEVKDRIVGVRQDEEQQTTLHWSGSEWMPFEPEEA